MFKALLASLSALYRQAGLTSKNRELAATLTGLSESLTKLAAFHGRMEGSLRSLSNSFDKARKETVAMVDRLEKLQEHSTESGIVS